jgi:hypothetical protein
MCNESRVRTVTSVMQRKGPKMMTMWPPLIAL